jgi:hypothetical protein
MLSDRAGLLPAAPVATARANRRIAPDLVESEFDGQPEGDMSHRSGDISRFVGGANVPTRSLRRPHDPEFLHPGSEGARIQT